MKTPKIDRIARGIMKSTASDEMSEVSTITLSVPSYGPGPDLSELWKVITPAREILERVKAEVGYDERLVEPGQNNLKPEPFSREFYLEQAASKISQLDKMLENEPSADAYAMVCLAIGLGKTIKELQLRDRNLPHVKRGVKVQDAARQGGRQSRGKTEQSRRIADAITALVNDGSKVTDAARKIARIKGCTEDAARQAYYRCRPQKR